MKISIILVSVLSSLFMFADDRERDKEQFKLVWHGGNYPVSSEWVSQSSLEEYASEGTFNKSTRLVNDIMPWVSRELSFIEDCPYTVFEQNGLALSFMLSTEANGDIYIRDPSGMFYVDFEFSPEVVPAHLANPEYVLGPVNT
jgi:hypothetical protein